MELTTLQQATQYINQSRKILLALPLQVSVDRLCSAYALQRLLGKMGKESTVATAAPVLPQLGFLPDMPEISPRLSAGQSLVISVSTTNAQLDELSYQTEKDRVEIFLKARGEGRFQAQDVTVASGSQSFDLIIILGAQTLEDLGEVYQKNTDLFFNTPKINFDTAASNEYFGTINLIDVTASSLSEVVTQVIAALEDAVTDEAIATSLLGGIIANTHSFQDPATTPKTLTTASALIAQGAQQQDVVKSLYKTKDFSLLKLWGRALARIKTIPEVSLLYSMLTRSDFERTGEDSERLLLVLRELLENVAGFQTVVLLGEQVGGTQALVAGLPHANILSLARKLSAEVATALPLSGLYQYVSLNLPETLTEAEEKLLAAVRT